MKNISAWAIRHPIIPIVLFVVLFFIGSISFMMLPINLQPDISFPLVSVMVSQPGAAPTELETQVAQKIEGQIASIGNIHNITTRLTEGLSYTNVEFQIGTPIDRAVNDVRDAVAKVRSQLPQGIDEPQIQRVDVDGGPFAYFGVTTTGLTLEQLSWFVDNTINKRLLGINGVAQVFRSGGLDREIRVNLDPARLQALGLTAVEVNQQLRQLNLDAPGGRAEIGGGEQSIRVRGGAKSALDLGNSHIYLSSGRYVRLNEIADVLDSSAEVRHMSRYNGRLAVTFGVAKSKGASDVTVSDLVDKELKKIGEENPQIHISKVFTTVDHTLSTYHSAMSTLVEGSILAVVVVWLFLRNGRATAISALAIPLSAIPTFGFMEIAGFTLNQITLLALSLVAGVLVDDAIVEIENIVRHMRMGKTAYQAALDAADEIGLAVVATSFTIIAVFLPVSFMGGVSGQFFKQFGLTVAVAVFISLLVARLITPVIAAFTLRPDAMHAVHDGPIMAFYMKTLDWCVKHRWRTIAAGVGFFVLSVGLISLIPQAFVPPDDFSASQLSIELPPGVTLDETAHVSAAATALLRKQPEVLSVTESIGDDDDIRKAAVYIQLVPPSERDLSQKAWEQKMSPLLAQIPDGRINFANFDGGGGRDVMIYLTGDDPQLVHRTAVKVLDEMQGLKELRDPRINGDLPRPEIVVRPRLDIAAQLGVTVESISQTIRIATIGDLPQNGAKFSLSDRQIPIRVSLTQGARHDLATLENLPLPTAGGGSVPLKSVAEVSFAQGPSTVRRYNQTRRVALEADLAKGVELGSGMKKIKALPTLQNLPQGVRLVELGNAEFMNELFSNFLLAIGAGVLMMFAVLVLLFARVFQPITILSALPLSLGGAALGLVIAGIPFSLPVVIGVIMLMGIVAKNSILLVDFAIEEMRAGRSRLEAIKESGHKRARPIVMTTVAMVAGMLPVALGIGGDSSFRAPMAIAVIGGLITSTMLTLVIVPAVFTVIDDVERWVAPKTRRVLAASDAQLQHQP